MKNENEIKEVVEKINEVSTEWLAFVTSANEDAYTDRCLENIISLSENLKKLVDERWNDVAEDNEYIVIISENAEGHVDFDELIIKVTETYEEAERFVLNKINPMIEKDFTNTEDLAEYLIYMEDEYGFSPLYDIKKGE